MRRQAPSAGGGQQTSISSVRHLMEKAHNGGLTASESVCLKAALERIEARAAALNARFGRNVVETSPAVRVFGTADAHAVVSF